MGQVGWHEMSRVQPCTNLLFHLLTSNSLQAEDRAAAPRCGGCILGASSGGLSSCDPFPDTQQRQSGLRNCFLFWVCYLTSRHNKIIGNSSQVCLVFSISMMQQVFVAGHRSLFLFCGRRFNYSVSEPHPSFPVQSPSRASLCVLGMWSHRVVFTAFPLGLPKQ